MLHQAPLPSRQQVVEVRAMACRMPGDSTQLGHRSNSFPEA